MLDALLQLIVATVARLAAMITVAIAPLFLVPLSARSYHVCRFTREVPKRHTTRIKLKCQNVQTLHVDAIIRRAAMPTREAILTAIPLTSWLSERAIYYVIRRWSTAE